MSQNESIIESVKRQLVQMRNARRLSFDEAASELRSNPIFAAITEPQIEAAVAALKEEGRRNQVAEYPPGFSRHKAKDLLNEIHGEASYAPMRGVNTHQWDLLAARMKDDKLSLEAIESIDQAATKVVANLGDPFIDKIKKKGLVLGYVQSGKTANYQATIAKAADEGFRFFIVLAGIHNNLRSQTQERLDRDVIGSGYPGGSWQWQTLTDIERDFGAPTGKNLILGDSNYRVMIVMKKNASRIRRLLAWLDTQPDGTLERCPTLIIDDEADQAGINTAAHLDQVSTINGLLRDLVAKLPSARYLGYTATPFANLFIDPRVEDDLYPEDFIIDLPRPTDYFGAERFFGIDTVDDDERVEVDLTRYVPDADEGAVTPPRGKDARQAFDPELPDSLRQAVMWFLLTRAVRRLRGDGHKHASMLVHTSQFTDMHFKLAERIDALLDEFKSVAPATLMDQLREVWEDEVDRVPPEAVGLPRHSFAELEAEILTSLSEVEVIVDNGRSDNRLTYEESIPSVVIAVGGATLSRGLTLEGLSVSYFLRTTGQYDTLLQMGRWFGFRKGYEDLPRVWTTREMAERFRFLALVEAELRSRIGEMNREGSTPRDVATVVLEHPTMTATAGNRMGAARQLSTSFARVVRQTFRFDVKDSKQLQRNNSAARGLVSKLLDEGVRPKPSSDQSKWIFRDVSVGHVIDFVEEYELDDAQYSMPKELMVRYLRGRSDEVAQLWNVALMGSSKKSHRLPDGSGTYDSGSYSFSQDISVTRNVRSRLFGWDGSANIKALMSPQDVLVDLDENESFERAEGQQGRLDVRRDHLGGRGLLLLYPIANDSPPLKKQPSDGPPNREALGAEIDVMGYGIVFPEPAASGRSVDIEWGTIGLPPEVFESAPSDYSDEFDLDELELLVHDDSPSSSVDLSTTTSSS